MDILVMLFFLAFVVPVSAADNQPHIIFILADDLGWDDVSFHGSSQILTPHLDDLALNGVTLFNYYVQPICTPTRSALMSGRYPIHTGLQHKTIAAGEPYGLGLNETTIAAELKLLGYETHAVGKWHLGYHSNNYLPINRGFDSFYGYYNGHEDYYNHVVVGKCKTCVGIDFNENGTPYKPVFGQYSTLLFTQQAEDIIRSHNASKPLFLYLAYQAVHLPLEAPQMYIDRFPDIENVGRRKHAGMVSALDDAVGNITKALKSAGLYNNSVIIFSTDNGAVPRGMVGGHGSNWPLRGTKWQLWEGGVRGAAFVHSPLIKKPGKISNEMTHVTDWLPTLYNLAGGDSSDLQELDGYDVWSTISEGAPSPRREILHNIDPIYKTAALRSGDYKIILGELYDGHWSGWYPPEGMEEPEGIKAPLPRAAVVSCPEKPANASTNCQPAQKPCLFNIRNDPCEFYNIADWNEDIVSQLMKRLEFYNTTAVPPKNVNFDPNSNPTLHGGYWVPWM